MNQQFPEKTKATGSTQSEKNYRPRYVVLWERIQQLQQRLNHQEAMHEHVLRQFATIIRPLEESITQELLALTQDLIRLFHASDSDANRSLLGFWIIDNIATLNDHPFAPVESVESTYDHWRHPIQGTEDMVEAQLSLLMAGRNDLPGQSKQRRNYPDSDMFAARPTDSNKAGENPNVDANKTDFDDLFSNTETHRGESASVNSSASAHEPRNIQDANNNAQSHNNKSRRSQTGKPGKNSADAMSASELGELFDIDKLFRRIARAVHPDRELDEAEKQRKHDIMSLCLTAREESNIAELLSLYATHVGDLPDTWSDESTGELVTALELQLRELEQRHHELRSQDPLLELIHDRYVGYNTNDIEQRIGSHKESLNNELNRVVSQRMLLQTDEGFDDAMEERRDIEMDKLVVADLTS